MSKILIHTLIHSFVDNIKLLPFLFFAFLIIELIEHKFNKKTIKIIKKSGKFGPVIGSILGIIPQCGFSVLATNFYITRVISIGTLLSIYLSTSDEMLPIMISSGVPFKTVFGMVLIKVIAGMFFGFLIDFLIRKREAGKKYDYHMCEEEHCDCEDSLLKSSLKHTFNTLIFIIIISFILNLLYEFVGNELVNKIFMKNNLFGPFIGSLIGLIPNCGSSVALTELFINGAINFGTCISGLLTGSGVALLVLFKSNKNLKENLFILSLLYLIGVLVGITLEIMGIIL